MTINLKENKEVESKMLNLLKVIPSFQNDSDNAVNPFVEHIIKAGNVSDSLFKFLENSDFLTNMDEQLFKYSVLLYDSGADINWYMFMYTIFEEEEDRLRYELLCELIYNCFAANISYGYLVDKYENWNHENLKDLAKEYSSLEFIGDIDKYDNNITCENSPAKDSVNEEESLKATLNDDLEKNETDGNDLNQDLILFARNIFLELRNYQTLLSDAFGTLQTEQKLFMTRFDNEIKYLDEKNKVLTEEKNLLETKLSENFSQLDESYATIKELKRELLKSKSEIEGLNKKLESKDKYIKRNCDKSNDYIEQIQKLEDENDKLNIELSEVKDKLKDSVIDNNDKVEKIKKLEKELNESSIACERYKKDLLEYIEHNSKNKYVYENEDALSESVDEVAEQSFYMEDDIDAGITEEMTSEDIDMDISFSESEGEIEEQLINNYTDDTQQDKIEIDYVEAESIESKDNEIYKKCNWFSEHLFNYSKNTFLDKPREEQENMIFMKVMEIGFPLETTRFIKKTLQNFGDSIPCFDLYKFICSKPGKDELSTFFAERNFVLN